MQTLEKPLPTDPGRDVRRAWWSLALFVPSFVLAFVLPLLVTVPLSRRAARAGRRDGWWPAIVGGVVAGVFLFQNLLSLAVVLIAG
jgi:hypothetical protein